MEDPTNTPKLTEEQEAAIFFPKSDKVKVGDREYEIRPLKFKQQLLLFELSKLDTRRPTPETLNTIVDAMAAMIGEKDREFLLENLDIDLVNEISTKVKRVTFMGMPKGEAPKGKTNGEAA